MLLVDKLDLVWHIMSANLLSFVQIDSFLVLAHVEIPNSEERFSEAVHRLVCLNNSLLVWAEVVEKGSNSEASGGFFE